MRRSISLSVASIAILAIWVVDSSRTTTATDRCPHEKAKERDCPGARGTNPSSCIAVNDPTKCTVAVASYQGKWECVGSGSERKECVAEMELKEGKLVPVLTLCAIAESCVWDGGACRVIRDGRREIKKTLHITRDCPAP
jgi:hypothetical protein